MKSQLLNIRKSPFVRNVLIMSTGTAAAQAISMASYPIITRLYGPEAYGIFGIFNAIIAVLAPIAALTYPIAVVLPKSDKEAKSIVRLSLYVTIGLASAVTIIFLLFKQFILDIFSIEEVSSFLFLIPIFILFSGFLQVIEQWLIRTKQFGITAKVTFIQSIILQGGKVAGGLLYPFASVLIILTTLGSALKALLLAFGLRQSNFKLTYNWRSSNGDISIRKVAKKHRDFPLYRAPQVFINGLSESIPVLLLGSLFGPVTAGFYSIGRTALTIPTQLIGKSVGDVFYPKITDAANEGKKITGLIKRATLALAMIGGLPFGIIIAFGPWLFSIAFGEEWMIAGDYARWMSLWIFSMFLYQPCIKAFPVLSAQGFHLKYTILTLVIRLLSLVVGYYLFSSALIAIALLGTSSGILNIIMVFITLRKSKRYDQGLIRLE